MKQIALRIAGVLLLASTWQTHAQDTTTWKLTPPVPPLDFGRSFLKAMDEADTGDCKQAIVDADESLELATQQLGPDDNTVGKIARILAELHYCLYEYDQARPLLERALRVEGKPTGPNDIDLEMAKDLVESGRSLEIKSPPQFAKATPLFKRALAIREKLGRDYPDVVDSLSNLAENYVYQDKFADAEPLFERILAISEKTNTRDDTRLIIPLNNMGLMYLKQKRYADAEHSLNRALSIAEKKLKPDHSILPEILGNLARLYKESGRQAEAAAMTNREEAVRAMAH